MQDQEFVVALYCVSLNIPHMSDPQGKNFLLPDSLHVSLIEDVTTLPSLMS